VFRFSVRRSPLPGRYGVWDGHANDWYGDWALTEPEANRRVHDLDVRYDFYADRKPSDVRQLAVAVPVVLYGWQPLGDLDVWVRDDGRWWGRVRDNETGLFKWYPAEELQPARSDQRRPLGRS
jgi:hypothetical protein